MLETFENEADHSSSSIHPASVVTLFIRVTHLCTIFILATMTFSYQFITTRKQKTYFSFLKLIFRIKKQIN